MYEATAADFNLSGEFAEVMKQAGINNAEMEGFLTDKQKQRAKAQQRA